MFIPSLRDGPPPFICVLGSCIAIPSYGISCICAIAHIVGNLLDRVFLVDFQTILGAFCVVANRIVLDYVSPSSNFS